MAARVALLLLWLSLAGCIAAPPGRPEPSYLPTYPLPAATAVPEPGAIYAAGGTGLFADPLAGRVGDVLTVTLEEQTQASKSSDTSITKNATSELNNPVVGTLGIGNGVVNSLNNNNSFDGEADTDQSNSLTGTLTVVVAERLPNGLLRVQGEKWLNLGQGEEFIRVSGLVRPADIGPDNSVSSLRIADARIAYSATGVFASANRAGWLSRFFLSPLLPF